MKIKKHDGGVSQALAWLDSYRKVSTWLESKLKAIGGHQSIDELLESSGGLLKIQNLLPQFVADAVLTMLESRDDWTTTEANENYSANNINHQFFSARQGGGLDAVYQALALLRPGELNSFSAARYQTNHHIDPHDDRAYTQVKMEGGAVIKCSRDVAMIYYLTKDWKDSYGGLLVDIEGSQTYIPEYNSAIIFQVPRFHQVTPVATHLPRFSLFGWWLVQGEKYELNLTAPEDDKSQMVGEPMRRKRKAPPLTFSVLGHSTDQKLWDLRKRRQSITGLSHKP